MTETELPRGVRTRAELFEHLRSVQQATTKSGMYSCFESWCDPEGVFNPAILAKDIVDNNRLKTDSTSDTIYFYDQDLGFYDKSGDDRVRALIEACLASENRQHRTTEVTYLVHSKTLTTTEPSRKIALENGLLNPETQTLEDFTPDEFVTLKMPVRYDQKAECPNIKKFLADVVGEDQSPIIQEWFGYCLYGKTIIHKALLLVGEGANGKSTLLELLRKFLGAENVATVPLQTLMENRFATSQLYGKLANLCADLTDKPLAKTGIFKMLTGNDAITAEQKFKQPFTFVNHAKLTFSTNKVPETMDDTNAFFRRWIIVACGNVFSGDKCDPKILEKTVTPEELSGLLNWALDGLKRLLINGHFTTTENTEELRSHYIRKSNSSRAFIEETLVYDPDAKAFVPEAELYERYIAFCTANSLPSTRKAVLTQNIHQYLPQAKQTKERIEKENVHVWQFVRLQEPEEKPVPTVPTTIFTLKLKESKVWLGKPLGTLGTKPELNSTGLIPCPECKAKGKPMFFAADADLAVHMRAYHETEVNV